MFEITLIFLEDSQELFSKVKQWISIADIFIWLQEKKRCRLYQINLIISNSNEE